MSVADELNKRAQLQQDQYYKEVARADAHRLEGLKAVLALNGGGCVAMLGFMQALLTKGDAFNSFKPSGLLALAFFAGGLVLSTLLHVTRLLDVENTIKALLRRGEGHDRWGYLTAAVWALSGAAFLAGLVAVGVGMVNLDIKGSEAQTAGAVPVAHTSTPRSPPLVSPAAANKTGTAQ